MYLVSIGRLGCHSRCESRRVDTHHLGEVYLAVSVAVKGRHAEVLGMVVDEWDARGESREHGDGCNNLAFAQCSDQMGTVSTKRLHDFQFADNIDGCSVGHFPLCCTLLKVCDLFQSLQRVVSGRIDGQCKQFTLIRIGKTLQHGEAALFRHPLVVGCKQCAVGHGGYRQSTVIRLGRRIAIHIACGIVE